MRVLVVEDEPDVVEALTWGLEADGYVVDTADNGVDGLWKATENAYDVIVLDVMLPQLDGYQMCRRLREQERWTPILMLTAMSEDLDHAEGLDSGADGYLAKPFSYTVLLAHLRAPSGRRVSARPTVLEAAGLTLDLATHQVRRGTAPLDLTGREVAVLEHLMRNSGRVVPKAELLQQCWDLHFEGGSAVVEVLVHRLRRKIDPQSAQPVIETVRGHGYLIRREAR